MPAGVALHWRIHEVGDLCELDNAVVSSTDFAVLEAEDTAIQEDIFLAGEFVVEPGADFQK